MALLIVQTILLGLARTAPGPEVPALQLALCLALGAIISLFALVQVHRHCRPSDETMARLVLVHVGLMSCLLAMSGGIANPFADTYFLPVAVAVALLDARHAWRIVVFALVSYTAVSFVHLPLPDEAAGLPPWLPAGAWITHTLLFPLAAYFYLRIKQNLREKERQLREAYDEAAKASDVVALGSVAAGAAHELGTPLQAMGIVVEQLQAGHGHDARLRPSFETLQRGLAECTRTLHLLRRVCEQGNPAGNIVAADHLITAVVERFAAMCPRAAVQVQCEGQGAAPRVVADPALEQAILIALSNAANACPRDIRLTLRWNSTTLTISVRDRGPGIDPQLASRVGKTGERAKPPASGCGLGLLLAKVTARRLGGQFALRNGEGGGAVTEIAIPLASLCVN